MEQGELKAPESAPQSFGPEIAELVRERLSTARVPGCTLLRLSPRGVQRLAVGIADVPSQRPMTIDSIFHLFSGTKVVTAAALMLLVERGKLSLETDVREVIDELPLRYPVTLRRLASHTSGLPDTLRAFFAISDPAGTRPTTTEALARYRFAKTKRPGQAVQYRNVNFVLLAEVISRISGMSFEAFVRRELLDPWRSSAAFEVGSLPKERLATGHVRRFDPMRAVVRLLVGEQGRRLFADTSRGFVALREFDLDSAGAGGLLGSVDDFAPLLSEFLSTDDGVLTASSKRDMLTLQASGKAGIVSRDGVGLAWKRGTIGGVPFWNHEGGGAGFCTELRLYPKSDVGFAILMNVSHTKRLSHLAHDLCEKLRDA